MASKYAKGSMYDLASPRLKWLYDEVDRLYKKEEKLKQKLDKRNKTINYYMQNHIALVKYQEKGDSLADEQFYLETKERVYERSENYGK